jgi:hypothetical protein
MAAGRGGGLEALAAADRRDHQVQRGVPGVAAFLDQVLGRLAADPDLDKPGLLLGLVLAEVEAQTALAVVDLLHKCIVADREYARVWVA